MKHLLLSLSILASSCLFAQLSVNQNGQVGIGTTSPNADYKLHVKGNILISNYLNSGGSAWNQLQLRITNNNVTKIGSRQDLIEFWSPEGHWNEIHCESMTTHSDSSSKRNIEPIRNGLERVLELGTYSYDIENSPSGLKNELQTKSKRKYGFLSQEVQRKLSDVDIVVESEGYLLMEYDQIIPLLAAAIKEQQEEIESLKQELHNLNQHIGQHLTSDASLTSGNGSDSHFHLYQNTPNPFTERTNIRYKTPSNVQSIQLIISDLNGRMLNTLENLSPGNSSVYIDANSLDPGIYLYTLIADNKEIATLKMIISQ